MRPNVVYNFVYVFDTRFSFAVHGASFFLWKYVSHFLLESSFFVLFCFVVVFWVFFFFLQKPSVQNLNLEAWKRQIAREGIEFPLRDLQYEKKWFCFCVTPSNGVPSETLCSLLGYTLLGWSISSITANSGQCGQTVKLPSLRFFFSDRGYSPRYFNSYSGEHTIMFETHLPKSLLFSLCHCQFGLLLTNHCSGKERAILDLVLFCCKTKALLVTLTYFDSLLTAQCTTWISDQLPSLYFKTLNSLKKLGSSSFAVDVCTSLRIPWWSHIEWKRKIKQKWW